MQRYIRTKDGKIYDNVKEMNVEMFVVGNKIMPMEDIVKQADTIEELIEVGDLYTILLLVDMGEAIVEETYEIQNETDLDDFMKCIKMGDIAVKKLYTKQGRNYVLVAEKEVKDWRVI